MSDNILKLARRDLALREARAAAFEMADLLDGAPWNLVLLLSIAEGEGAVVRRRDATTRCRVSEPLFDRWVAALCAEGIVTAEPGPGGSIELTDDARARLKDMWSRAARDEA